MSRDIKVLHVEPTDVCQAACPLCARETDRAFDRVAHHLDMTTIHNVLCQDFIQRLDKMFMCGNYGDPAAGKHTLDIYREFRSINPTITLGMNTNGGLQDRDWWLELASILDQPKDYVVFSIDGLEDTNHMYRVNVDWNRVMQNATTFINAGGSAHWDMLVYQHNEHQVQACQDLAQDMGFRWFRAKQSKRPLVGSLKRAKDWHASVVAPPIHCHALAERSAYLDARGTLYPCCWLGYRTSSIHDITQVQVTWDSERPHPICLGTCGTVDNTSGFKNQWRREVELIN